jgi:hypothetical protein
MAAISGVLRGQVDAEQIRRHHTLESALPRAVRPGEHTQAGNGHGMRTRVPCFIGIGADATLIRVRVPSAATS